MRIAFVMPAFNEEALLGETVDGVLPVADFILIVNDGSQDRTGEIADGYQARYPGRVEVIHQSNTGIGGAVIAGMQRILATRPDIDALGITASDAQCDPALIPAFRRVLETEPTMDVVKGSRFLHPESLHTMPRFRYYGNRGISLLMQVILGYYKISDVLHGYLLGRRAVFERMDFSRIAQGYDLENTMMAEFRRLRCNIGLVPSPSRYGRAKSTIVLRTQIPRTLKRMGHLLYQRLSSGPLPDRLAPLMFITGNLPGAYLAMRLTSPEVRVFPVEAPAGPTDGSGAVVAADGAGGPGGPASGAVADGSHASGGVANHQREVGHVAGDNRPRPDQGKPAHGDSRQDG
jgi:glycosyltransferase involved in cell wall biosynthesis